eukprot:2646492-Pleurochrysis_carterae.AAC.1
MLAVVEHVQPSTLCRGYLRILGPCNSLPKATVVALPRRNETMSSDVLLAATNDNFSRYIYRESARERKRAKEEPPPVVTACAPCSQERGRMPMANAQFSSHRAIEDGV